METQHEIPDSIQGVGQLIETTSGGALKQKLDGELKKILQAIEQNGGSGEINIKLKFKQQANTGAIEVEHDIKTKAPEPRRRASLFFMTPEYNLSRNDYRQPELPLRADIHG